MFLYVAGEELFQDYREMAIPAWFKEFCREYELARLHAESKIINFVG